MKNCLIIGGTGSLGKKLIDRLVDDCQLSIYSRDENKHWTCKNELSKRQNIVHMPKFYIGDVRDRSRLCEVMNHVHPDTIIIAAALKQVDTCEYTPNEAVATNLVGTQNVIHAVHEYNRGCATRPTTHVLFVSTDKACAPINVYGMCKAISERLVCSQALTAPASTRFMCTRYGNVLESRGSIIPLFMYQVMNSDYVTVTDPKMTRFLMTLDQSIDLILHALRHGASGETWIPILPAMCIGDLAAIFAQRFNKQIRIIGPRPGEKTHEDLVNVSESARARSTEHHHVIDHALVRPGDKTFSYSSDQNVMDREQLELYLDGLGIFSRSLSSFTGQAIEEIRTT